MEGKEMTDREKINAILNDFLTQPGHEQAIDAILALFPIIEVKEECGECGGIGKCRHVWPTFFEGVQTLALGQEMRCTKCGASNKTTDNRDCSTCHGTVTRRIPITSEQAQGMYESLRKLRPVIPKAYKKTDVTEVNYDFLKKMQGVIDNALSFLVKP